MLRMQDLQEARKIELNWEMSEVREKFLDHEKFRTGLLINANKLLKSDFRVSFSRYSTITDG